MGFFMSKKYLGVHIQNDEIVKKGKSVRLKGWPTLTYEQLWEYFYRDVAIRKARYTRQKIDLMLIKNVRKKPAANK